MFVSTRNQQVTVRLSFAASRNQIINLERPQEINQAVLEFLSGNTSTRP